MGLVNDVKLVQSERASKRVGDPIRRTASASGLDQIIRTLVSARWRFLLSLSGRFVRCVFVAVVYVVRSSSLRVSECVQRVLLCATCDRFRVHKLQNKPTTTLSTR